MKRLTLNLFVLAILSYIVIVVAEFAIGLSAFILIVASVLFVIMLLKANHG